VLYNAGDRAEGERLIRAGIQDAERFGVVTGDAAYYGRVLLATVLGRRGDLDEAHTLVDGMRDRLPTGMPSFVAGLLDALKGWLLGLSGDPEEGLRLHRRTIAHFDGHPLTSVIIPRIGVTLIPPAVTLLERLATPTADRRGVLLIGAHDRLRPTAIGPLERQSLDESAAVLRERLGPAAYDALYAEGEGLALEEAIALMSEAP
jgi:hypothetical protein